MLQCQNLVRLSSNLIRAWAFPAQNYEISSDYITGHRLDSSDCTYIVLSYLYWLYVHNVSFVIIPGFRGRKKEEPDLRRKLQWSNSSWKDLRFGYQESQCLHSGKENSFNILIISLWLDHVANRQSFIICKSKHWSFFADGLTMIYCKKSVLSLKCGIDCMYMKGKYSVQWTRVDRFISIVELHMSHGS